MLGHKRKWTDQRLADVLEKDKYVQAYKGYFWRPSQAEMVPADAHGDWLPAMLAGAVSLLLIEAIIWTIVR